MDGLDEALNRWPRRDDSRFLKEMTEIAAGLDELAHRSEEEKDEAAERRKCWLYAGMAHFERGMALHTVDDLYNVSSNKPAANAFESEVLLPVVWDVRRYMRWRLSCFASLSGGRSLPPFHIDLSSSRGERKRR